MQNYTEFEGVNLITDPTQKVIAEVLVKNELGDISDGYQLDHASTSNSEYSFGGNQMNIGYTINAYRSKFVKTILLVLTFCLFGSKAYADACWMTGGCKDRIVYIYVPQMQYEHDVESYKKCADWKVFDFNGLPKIGDIVEVAHKKSGIKAYENLDLIKERYEGFGEYVTSYKYKDLYKNSKELETCLEYSYMTKDSEYGKVQGDIGCNMELEIISYIKLKEGLFALVKVLTSGDYSQCQ